MLGSNYTSQNLEWVSIVDIVTVREQQSRAMPILANEVRDYLGVSRFLHSFALCF
jgi:hypothetical protein